MKLSSTYATDVQISVSGANETALKALYLGTEAGAVVSKPTVVNLNGKWMANWIYRVQAGQDSTVFVITNIDDEPDRTTDLTATLEVATTGSNNNLAYYGPEPPPKTPLLQGKARMGQRKAS